MTVRDQILNSDYPRVDWCNAYTGGSERYKILIINGKINTVVMPDGTFYNYDGTLTAETVKNLARAVNDYYDDYSGYDDLHIALDAMHKLDCPDCPWFNDCELMNKTINDDGTIDYYNVK